MRNLRGDLHTERTQVFGDDVGRAKLAIGKFGVGVEIPPPFNDFGLEGIGNLVDGTLAESWSAHEKKSG
jgi:hypothetical protein